MKTRYFVSRALLLCLLIVPVILIHGPYRIEPYPAVILPRGGHPGKYLGSEFRVQREFRLYILKKNAEVKVDYIQFFRPMSRYAKYIMKNNFGLGKEGGGKFHGLSATTRREGIKWIKHRLNKLTGLDKEVIKGLKYEQCRLEIYYDPERPNKERCYIKSVILF